MSVRLYAVLRLPPRVPSLPPGLQGERLRLVKGRGWSLAVADVKSDVQPAVENLLEFDRVIRALAGVSQAILPARFGAVSRTLAAMQSELAERAQVLSAALNLVSGRTQMTIRIAVNPKELTGSERRRSHSESGTGAAYLHARAAASSPPALAHLRNALKTFVLDERIAAAPGGIAVYHLIAVGDIDAYVERADGFAVSGPFPPYAFVPGIDHAISHGHGDKKSKPAGSRPARPRAHRRSAGNTDR